MRTHHSLRFTGAASAALVASLGVSACTPVEPVATPLATLDDYYAQEFSWGECDADWILPDEQVSATLYEGIVECAVVRVPAVYTDSEAEAPDFDIVMMRRAPVGLGHQGTIFINPGGPGVSGVEQLQYSDFPDEMLENFAIVGFDPRGVGHSKFSDGSTIRCSDELDFVTYFEEGSPANEAELDELVGSIDRLYEQCSEANPWWWTLSTDAVARDLDILREVVTPEQPLNFIGSSYGTTIAGRYVSYFPDNVGKIVFDSPTTVDTDRIESSLTKLAADEEKLRGFVQGYADNQGISFGEAWDVVMYVRQLGDDDRLYGFAGIEPSPEFPDDQISSEALFAHGIAALNYIPEDQALQYFTQGLFEAREYQWNGTFESLAFWLDGYDPDSLEGATLEDKNIVRSNEFEIRVIVNTMDLALPPLSEEEQRELSARSAEVAPLLTELYSDPSGYEYYGPPKGLSWEQIAFDDPEIPDPPSEPFVPSNPSGKPLLIVGSTNESVTPFSFAEDTAELLGATLITVESDIHAPVAYYDNDCVNDALMNYLLDRGELKPVRCAS